MRVSGKRMAKDGAAFLGGYIKQGEGGYEIDTGVIEARMKEYFEEAAAADRYSIAGLCISLGITRDALDLWRAGYVCGFDAQDKRTMRNDELSDCILKGELYVHRYWEESDKSTTLHTKFLESAGLLTPKAAAARRPPFDLGRLKKYAK